MPPPKTQPAKTWCLSKNQHMFALRKRNAWRHLPESHHQAKSNPRLNEKITFSTQSTFPWWAVFPGDWENTLEFSARASSAHHGLFAYALLQKQLLLLRADPNVQPTPEWELLAAAALAFLKSSFDCSAAGSRDRPEKAHQNLETKFNAKFRSCFAKLCV